MSLVRKLGTVSAACFANSACGVSAFPMAARTAHALGREEDPDNWLLPQSLATNVGGQIASVAAGGAILTYAPLVLSLLGIS